MTADTLNIFVISANCVTINTNVMDPKNTNHQSSSSTGSGRQAIFTPVPETDEDGTTVSPASSPVASTPSPFFSQPVETGDIIIGGSEPKPTHNKRPFIIGGIIFLVFAVVATVIVAVISSISRNAPATVAETQEAFTSYRTYLEQGSSDTDSDQWFLLKLLDGNDTTDVNYAEYTTTLQNRYDTFTHDFAELKLDLSDAAKTSLESTIADYGDMLATIIFYANRNDIVQEVTDKYITSKSEAESYINNLLPESEMTSKFTQDVSKAAHLYFTTRLEMLDLYQSNNCLVDGHIDGECVANIYQNNNRLRQLTTEANRYSSSLDASLPSLVAMFETQTGELTSRIGALHD